MNKGLLATLGMIIAAVVVLQIGVFDEGYRIKQNPLAPEINNKHQGEASCASPLAKQFWALAYSTPPASAWAAGKRTAFSR